MVTRQMIFTLAFATFIGLAAQVSAQEEPYNPVIDPANFVEGVDHPYFRLTPGAEWEYEGQTEDGLETIEVTVLSDTKEVMGIPCVVVRDTVYLNGEIIEDTYDWFAQDKDGNVWYMGEDTHEYEDGVAINSSGAWEAGVDGALPGIIMPAVLEPGEPYRQEYYEGEAEDMGQIIRVGETLTIGDQTYEDVLVTKDWSLLEPDVIENKYYAPGVGLIAEEKVEGGSERVELVEFEVEDTPETMGNPEFTEDDDAGDTEDDDANDAEDE
jgi:hypothetical protein